MVSCIMIAQSTDCLRRWGIAFKNEDQNYFVYNFSLKCFFAPFYSLHVFVQFCIHAQLQTNHH